MNFGKKPSSEKEPIWKISTKIAPQNDDMLVKVRKNKVPTFQYVRAIVIWFKNYIRTVGGIFLGGLALIFIVVMNTTPMFSLKPDKIDLILEPEPVFDRAGITSILRDFSGRNIVTLGTQEIFKNLSENIRHIQSVEKTLLFPDGIRVRITSFPPRYRAIVGEDVFLLTENGQLIPDIPEVEVPKITVHSLSQDPQLQRSTPIHQDDMYLLSAILRTWQTSMPEYAISQIDFYDQEKELHLTSRDTRFILTLYDGVLQIKTLADLIKAEAINTSRQYYIDLRIPARIYSCDRDKAECARNIRNIYGVE